MLRVGLIQMQSEKGDINKNLSRIATFLDEAERIGIDIVAFPEASLTGYVDPVMYSHAVVSLDGPEVGRLLTVTRRYSSTVLVGVVEANPTGKPFVTHIVARRGELLGLHRKIHNVDEDAEWFACGTDVSVYRSSGETFGISVCADLNVPFLFERCAAQGAKIVFEVAAPGLYGAQETRNWQTGFDWWEAECSEKLGGYARKHNLWIAVATQAGRTVDEDFPGGGYLFSPTGDRVYGTPDWSPGAVFLEVDFDKERVAALE